MSAFSLVELLAVALIIAVLAVVAIALYMPQRKSSAARACLENLSMVSGTLTAHALRFGAFPAPAAGNRLPDALLTSPEARESIPTCPLDSAPYFYTVGVDGTCELRCERRSLHAAITGWTEDRWIKSFPSPGSDTLP
jgi:type II secretory pathway pseudopilin PulG